jgi:cytochrome c oxidase assembly protein subunit 11
MDTDLERAKKRTLRQVLVVVAGMFLFVFALVPLYSVLCDVTGLNGKTSNERQRVADISPDNSRTVTVEFLASVNESMPWDFRPSVTRMKVHPGEVRQTSFVARNRTQQSMVGQAIPSVAPGLAALHFKKTECFCFTEQKFAPGEEREMPLVFMVDKDLPEDISTVTLAYTFFDKQKLVQ